MPRKASPKPIEVDRRDRSYGLLVTFVVGCVLVFGTIMWARSDRGQIDVSAAILNSQVARNGEAGIEDNAPAVLPPAPPENASKPNGGLQAQGGEVTPQPEPTPPPVVESTSTASTTEETADSPEEGTDSTESADTTDDAGTSDAPSDTTEEGSTEDTSPDTTESPVPSGEGESSGG
jgi:type IV secretory pathway VirB10-like protein